MSIRVSHTERSKATPDSVWKLWSTLSSWSAWDHGVVWCRLKEGHRFQVGGEALLQPKQAPEPVSIRITECVLNQSFTDVGTLELGTLRFAHYIERQKDEILITHALEFTPASTEAEKIFRDQMLPKLQQGLPASVVSLARLAEQGAMHGVGGRS